MVPLETTVQNLHSGIPSGHSTHLFEIVSSVLNTLLDSKRNLKPGWTSILIIVKLKRAPKLFLNRLMQECSKNTFQKYLFTNGIITNAESVLAFPESISRFFQMTIKIRISLINVVRRYRPSLRELPGLPGQRFFEPIP